MTSEKVSKNAGTKRRRTSQKGDKRNAEHVKNFIFGLDLVVTDTQFYGYLILRKHIAV